MTSPLKLKSFARRLRRDMTDAERRIWYFLCRDQTGVRFYRQRVLGPYIVDFYAPAARLVVEIDGGQHYLEGGIAQDALRDNWLNRRGLLVQRFDSRSALLETEAVVMAIGDAVKRRQS